MSKAVVPSFTSHSTRFFLLTLPIVVSLVLCFSADVVLAQSRYYGYPRGGRHYNSAQYRNAPSKRPPAQQEGIRNVFVKMSPELKAKRDEVLNNHDPIPAPELPELIDGKHPAVARIDVEGERGVVYHGSGTLVGVSDTYGIVLTNWHVVRDRAGQIRVRFPDGEVYEAKIVKTDDTWDLAALKIARPNIHPVALSDRVPELGDPLTVAGYGGGTYRQASGRLLQYCAPNMKDPTDILEVTTASRSGDSGGPIFHHDGTLAGVLFGSIDGTTNGSHCKRVQKFVSSISSDPAYAIHTHGGPHASAEPIIRGQQY